MENITNTANTSSSQTQNKTYSYPDQIKNQAQEIASIVKVILEIPKNIASLRRTLRGEALYSLDDGSNQWVQVVKPVFIQLDPITRLPLKKIQKFSDEEEREVYLPNDEAIEELLSQLFFMGMNNITPLTNLSEDNILDDLKEFECKLAALLCLKQVSWGLDKELLPMQMSKIKTLVQDARYMCAMGTTMKSLSQQVSRIEQVLEETKSKSKLLQSPYG